MPACIVSTYVYTAHTTTLFPLVLILTNIQPIATQFLYQRFVNTAAMFDTIFIQVLNLRTRHKFQTSFSCHLAKLTCHLSDFKNRWFSHRKIRRIPFRFLIQVHKTNHTRLSIPFQTFCKLSKVLDVIVHSYLWCNQYRVIAPHYPIATNLICQLFIHI